MSSSKGNICMIGGGAMGFALLERLVAHGFAVSIFDPSPAARERASTAGAKCLEDAESIFSLGNPVITCLASPKAFTSTIEAAIAASHGNGRVGPVIEASTLDPVLKEEARVRLAAIDIVLLDCPMSGTSAQARNGDVVIFASGDQAVLASCDPIFAAIARKTIQAGDFGNGMQLKLLANHLVGLHSAAAAEVLLLARKSGLEPEVALNALTQSAGTSRMLEVRGKLMIGHEYLPPTASIDIIVKDGEMIRSLAQRVGCPLSLFDNAHDLFRSAQAEGLGGEDIAGIHGYLLKHSSDFKRNS